MEEAISEAPRASRKVVDALSMADLVSETLSRVATVEEALQNAEIKFMEKLHESVLDVRHFDRVQFREEVRQSIIPYAVVNMVRSRVHKCEVARVLLYNSGLAL